MGKTNKKYKIFYAISDIGRLSKMDAKSLVEATEYLYPHTFKCEVNNILANGDTKLGKKIGKRYDSKMAAHEVIYEISYKYSDLRLKTFLKSEDGRKMIDTTSEIISRENPDLIVSLSPLINTILFEALSKLEVKIPTAMVLITKTIKKSFTKSILKENIDFDQYIVISSKVKKDLIKKAKVSEDKITLVDYPVKINFELIPDETEILNLKKHFDLPIDRRIVFFYGRSNGYKHIEKIVKHILKNDRLLKNAFFVIITRNNQNQYEELFKMVGENQAFRVIGFSDQFYEYVSICDLLFTSADEETIKQGLMLKKPIIITSYSDKEEKENIEFLRDKGYGTYVKNPAKVVDELESLILNTSRLKEIKNNYANINFKNGMIEIAQKLINLIDEYENFDKRDKVAKRAGFTRKRDRK
jgi:UDP-N-acetylglucosamine:LPS N-acetylglucosamine transferase